MELERQNPHWEGFIPYRYEKKRWVWWQLLSALNHNLIVGLFGMRRVGKTVLMQQLIAHLLQQGVEAKRILYFSFDDARGDFWAVVRAYEAFLGRRVGRGDYLFFDEIQKVEDWAEKVKLLYDTSKAKIFLTGSASALLKRRESLAGRMVEIAVEPLSFPEFLYFADEPWDPQLTERAERLYWRWVERPFPELVGHHIPRYVESVVEKAIYMDIPLLYGVEEVDRLHALLDLVRREPGFLLDYQKLASTLDLNRNTVARYVSYLEDAHLVRKLYNYSTNPFKEVRKRKKLYPSIPALSKGERPETVETAVAFDTGAQFFYRERSREVDFIVEGAAIEVKFRERLREEEFRFLRHYATSHNLRAVVVSKHAASLRNLEVIPYTHFPFSPYARWHAQRPPQGADKHAA